MYNSPRQVTRSAGKALVWVLVGLLLAIVAVVLLYPPKPLPEPTPLQKTRAGWIDSFDGPVSAYVLKHQDQVVKVGFLVPVYQGDKIEIQNQQHTLQLFLGGHQYVKVTYEDSPYTVKNVGKVPVPLTNVEKWAGEKLTGYHDPQCDPTKTVCEPFTVKTRSETSGGMLIPLLKYNPSQMVAGKRPLHLRWFGGNPPYQVTISNENGQSLVSESVKNQWLTTQVLSLEAAKTYQVTIKDAKEQTITETFEVVTAIDSPKQLQESSLSPASRQTIWAMTLASQERGLWMLEAYQQAAEVADKHYPARLLRNRLEKGLRVVK